MASTFPVNLTGNKIRKVGDEIDFRKFRVDPAFGIPAGGTPMWLDPTTGLVRPASSAVTLALVCDNFVGFTEQTFVPGECHVVQINRKGWVEMKLATPAAVIPGQTYKFLTVTVGLDTFVSDDTVALVADQGTDTCQIFSVVESCECNCNDRVECPSAAAGPVDVSPTSAPTRPVQRTVLLAWESRK